MTKDIEDILNKYKKRNNYQDYLYNKIDYIKSQIHKRTIKSIAKELDIDVATLRRFLSNSGLREVKSLQKVDYNNIKDDVQKLLNEGKSITDIASICKISFSSVKRCIELHKLDIPLYSNVKTKEVLKKKYNYIKKHYKDKNDKEIAKDIGISAHSLCKILAYLGIEKKDSKYAHNRVYKDEVLKMKELYQSGHTISEICKILNRDYKVVSNHLSKLGIHISKKQRNIAYFDKYKDDIKSKIEHGNYSKWMIANEYNISYLTIDKLIIKWNIKPNFKKRGKNNQMELLKEDIILKYKNGYSLHKIGNLYRVSAETVKNYLLKWGEYKQ